MEEQPIESENVEAVETTGGDDRGKRLQAVYSMLDSDEAYRPYVPATYDEFVGKIAKDRNYAQAIHKMVASDEVYSQYLPETFDETVTYFGLGKPSPTPQSGSGLGSTQSGGQMPMAQQPKSGASPSSAQNVDFGFKKVVEEIENPADSGEVFRLPTEAEFAQIEKKQLTKEQQVKEAVRISTPPVERFTKDIAYNKAKILSTENELKKTEQELSSYKGKIDSSMAIYENESLSPQERNKAVDEYNRLIKESTPLTEKYNTLANNYNEFIANEKVLFNELDKAEKMRQKGLEKEYSHSLNLIESVGRDLLKTVSGITKMGSTMNSVIPNFGLITPEEEKVAKESLNNGLSELNAFAEKLISQETPENYKKLFEGDFSLGKLAYVTTNAISSTVPTVAAGLLTGPIGAMTAGAGLGFEESKEIMQDAGLNDTESDWAALGLAIPIGLLEKYGADDVVKLLNGSGLRREVASELAKKIAGKSLTKDAIFLEAKKTFGEVIKSKTTKLLKEGGKESFTEMAQGELQEGVKQIVQEFTGVDKDENMSTEDYLKQQLMQRTEEGVGGFLGGSSMQGGGMVLNSALNKKEFSPSAYTKAMEFADPAKYEQFKQDLLSEVENGVLTEDQANEAIANVNAIQETNALIPNSIKDLDLRTDAINLIIEKNNLTKEISEKDPDLTIAENERLAEIKKSLNDISLGKKPNVFSDEILAAAKPKVEQQPTETTQPKVTVEEIKSLPLTRIEGAGMGSNQAVGTFISTEPENRYAAQFPDKEVQSMEVDIENPFVSEDTNLIDFRNELANRRKAELDETDFTEVEIPEGEININDLSDMGIEKVAGMVTEELKAQGYDSIYFPATKSNGETQEGELVVFDREKVRSKQTTETPTQDATQTGENQQSSEGEYSGTTQQQQGQQADRNNQEKNVAPSQAEAGGGNRVAEGGTQQEVAIENIDDASVDKADQTIIAYHATPTGKVSTGKEAGIHVGTKKAAEQVKSGRNQGKGTVEKVKTIIKRPLILSDMPSWSSANLLSQLFNPQTGQYFGLTRNDVRDIRDSDMTEKQKQQSVIDFLKKKGYDAIAYKNDSEDAGSYSYVLFEEPTIESGSTISEGVGQTQAETQQEVGTNQPRFFKNKPKSRDVVIIDINKVEKEKPNAFEFLKKYKGHESFEVKDIRNALGIAYNQMMRYKGGAENLMDQISDLEDILEDTTQQRTRTKEEFKKEAKDSGDFTAEQLDVFNALVDSLNTESMPEYDSFEESLAFVGIDSKKHPNFYSLSDNILSAKNPDSFIHEVGHFAFYNILSKQERLEFLQYMIDSSYGKEGKSLKERLAITSETIETEVDGKKMVYSTNAADNFSEYFAEQFRQWYLKEKTTPKQFDSIFQKVAEYLSSVIEKLKAGNFIDKNLVKFFDKIISDTKSERLNSKQEVTPEQQQRINTRALLSEISDWNKLGSKAKRTPEGVTEMQRLQKAGKELGLTVDTKAIKSGLRLVATNADGQVMTVEKVNKVMNPKRVVWSDANYAVQETTDANGNRVVEFYDAKTGDQIRSNSKEGTKAKEAYYEGNIQKFLGNDKDVDIQALAEYFDNDIDGFNKAVLEYVAESDNAFQIAANYQQFVNHDAELTENAFDPDYELGNLVGQISEADFKKYFDRNWLNKRSKWISEDAKRLPLDTRIQEWTSEGTNADTPYLQSLVGADESEILNAISDLVQAYPDGPQSIKPTKEGGLLPLASQRFRQLTGKPLNPVTAYEFNEMFNRYAENADKKEFGFASKVAWEDLSPQQKQEIIDEQTRPVEDEFFFEGTDFENQPELFAENEQDQGGTEEFPTEEQRDEIEEDGFAMPTDEEMAAKSEEIQTDLQKAIQDVKERFGDLFNQNLGIAYDPKVEARKLYNFHVALVNLAKTAIRSGITTAADFAQTLGKRLDKFTERAFNDAMNDINGDPMIINSEQDMLNAEYQRVAESYAKQREDAKKLKKPFLKRFIEGINAGWFDANYVSKKLLGDVGGYEAIKAKNLLGGASAKAKMQYDTFKREIFGGLNSAEKKLLNDIIQARTIISIDNRFDAKGEPRPKHPGDTTKESQTIFLGQEQESQPELFNKLNDRAEKYFNAQRELLDERLKEGRISIEQYQGMIDNDYSPRVFLEYLIDDVESGSGLTSGGQGSVGRSDIKSLSDGDVNSLFHNAEWLLASNVLATSRSIFHNRANRSLYELAKADPNNGFIEIQKPNGFNKETGQPTYKDPRTDQRQIQFFENGVRKSMLATREFGESWNNNNPLLSPQYANAIRIASGGVYKRLFATGINPLFALSNLPRDIAHSLFFTNAYSPTFPVALAQISTDLVRTAKDAWKFNRSKDKDGRYYKYTMQGGGMDFLATQGLPFEQQALIQSTAKDAMDATVKVLGYINNSSEIWVRLAIREREANKLTAKFARDNGRMPNTAEKEAIETSATEVARSQMDFSQGGRWAKAMDNLIPYLNASLQGLRVSVRYARENPKVFSYKVAQALAVSAAIAAYNMRFKDDYDDLEDEEKNRNIIIMLDFYKTVDGKKRRAYIRIPKNQSSQWIFAMGEIMGESMQAKEFRPRKGASTLQTLMPPYDPRNIPIIDALNTYETGYDRFREKYVYSKDYTGFEYAEYEENKTAWIWRDIGKQLGLSPIRLKAAVGKLTADPDNNMIWVAVTEAYDKLIKSVPEDEQKSVNDMAVESMEQMLTPVQRKFLAFTNPDSKSKSIRELEAAQATKIKLQNDTVKNYVKKYINDELTETEARSEFSEWLNTQPKDSVNIKRLKTRFENSIQLKDVDNVFYRMGETKYPEVKARLLFDAYLNAPDDDAREVLLFQAKSNPNVPKDKSSSFWKEFNRLKALGEE